MADSRGERKKRKRGEKREAEIAFPELLAPAGNLETFFAAIESGADAVYIGLGDFNARKRGENFSLPDLGKLIPYAHSQGVKVFLTFNTQVLEEELPRFIDTVGQALLFSPDALILSDLGAMRIVRKYFPRVEIHASTMTGIFNSRIASVLAELGARRVVAERHLDFDQLKELVRRSPIGVEVFIHGAMCYSFSGKCLFSSYLGGKSGNRGECVQPCRRVYRDDESGLEAPFFSAKDLSLVDMVPELVKLGVVAFKIEGRLRSYEYVRDVVRAYRRLLDRIKGGNPALGVKEAKEILEGVIGREITGGVLSGEVEGSVASSETGAFVGEFLGKVVEVDRPYVKLDGAPLVRRGERLRVQDTETGKGTGFTVTVIEVRNGELWLKVPFPVKEGDLVYRVSATSSRREITRKALEKFQALPTAGLRFTVTLRGSSIEVEGAFKEHRDVFRFRVSGASSPLEATEKELEEVLSRAYRGDMPLSEVIVKKEGDVRLNLNEVIAAFDEGSRGFDKEIYLEMKSLRVKIIQHLRLRGRRKERKPVCFYAAVDRIDLVRGLLDKVDYVVLEMNKNLVRNPQRLMPYPRETLLLGLPFAQGDQMVTFFRNGVERFCRMGFSSYFIPDIGWVKVFKEAKVRPKRLISDHYVYTFNTGSAVSLEELGVSRFVLPLENTLRNIEKIGRYIRGLGIFPVFARVPLLKTRLVSFPGEGVRTVTSRFAEKFEVLHSGGGTEIFPVEYFCAAEHIDDLMRAGISDFLIDLRGVPVEEVPSIIDNILQGRDVPGSSTFNLARKNF